MISGIESEKSWQLRWNKSGQTFPHMLELVIDNCAGDDYDEYDGLICHVTGALPQGSGIDSCALYGDYFYLEALMRYIKPDWKMYW